MPSKEQPKKQGKVADLFPVAKEANLFPTGGREANLFPDISAVETLQNAMTPALVDINMTERDDLNKPNFFLRALGIQEGIDRTVKSQSYQEMTAGARRLQNSSNPLAMMAGARESEAAGLMMGGNVAFSVADFESRPRKALINIIALRAQRGMDKVKNPRGAQLPLTKSDYVDAISRGWSGQQDMGMIRALEGAVSPSYRVAADRMLARHPRFAKVAGVVEAVEEAGIAILSEVAIAKGIGTAGKGFRSLSKIKFAGKAKATDTMADFVTDTVHHSIRLDTDADDIGDAFLKLLSNDQDAADNAFRNAGDMIFGLKPIEGALTPDDLVRGSIYQQYIFDSIQTKTNPSGVIKQTDMKNIIEAFTFGKKKMYNELDILELEDIAQQVESIKLAPKKMRENALEIIRRKSYGPPVNTFNRLGLEYNYTRVLSASYQGQDEFNGITLAIIRAKKQFKKTFKKEWVENNIVDNALSYALEGSKYDNLPAGIRAPVRAAAGQPINVRFPIGTKIEYDMPLAGVFGASKKRGTIGSGIVTGTKIDPITGDLFLELDGGKKTVGYFDSPRMVGAAPSAAKVVTTQAKGNFVTPEEYAFLTETADEIRDGWLNPWADIAEFQGKISSDPALIAAGVPPRVANHYHRVHDDISGYVLKRIKDAEEAGKKISIPVDYDLDKLIKEGVIPKGRPSPAWITRKAVAGTYSRNTTAVLQAYAKGVTYDLFPREEIINMKAAIDALPVKGGLKGKAKSATRQWALQIQNQPTGIDTTLNQAFNRVSKRMENIFPKWEAQERAFENFAKFLNRRTDQALLLGNPRPAIRNLFQPLLTTTGIYGHADTLWGYQALLTPGGRKLLKTSQVYLSRGVPLAMFDVTDPKSWRQLSYLGIHLTDKYLNVANAYLTGWRYYFKRSPKAWDELVTFGKTKGITEQSLKRGNTFSDTVADAVNAGHFQNIRRTIDFTGIGHTQWLYDTASMPPSLRSTFGRTALKYSSWTQNMWGAHMPQMIDQLMHGQDIFGMKMTPLRRAAIFGTVAKGALLYTLGENIGVNMSHLVVTGSLPQTYIMGAPMPIAVGPSTGTAIGLAATGAGLFKGGIKALGTMSIGALSEDNSLLDAGWNQLSYSLKSYVPGYGLSRQVGRTMRGEQPPAAILWPLKKEKKKKQKSITPTIPGIRGLPSFPKLEQ